MRDGEISTKFDFFVREVIPSKSKADIFNNWVGSIAVFAGSDRPGWITSDFRYQGKTCFRVSSVIGHI